MKTKPLNIESLTWLSDIHLEFLRQRKIDDFAKQVQAHPGKAVLITGDIATGNLLQSVLGTLARNIDRPIVYCLGNHDFYNSSFEKVEQAIAGAGQLFNNLIYLDGKSIIPLTEQTALIGINGWACGTGGIGRGTGIRLTDDTEILDFECLPTDDDRFNLMFQLAKGYAEMLRPTLRDALARFQNVIIGIHVPPFLEAAWHMGQISGHEFLPLFSSPTMGRMLVEEASKYPETKLSVYCGHTHSPGIFEVNNIKVWTAGPIKYFFPRIEGLIEIE
jgi:predicted phosphodiesterase